MVIQKSIRNLKIKKKQQIAPPLNFHFKDFIILHYTKWRLQLLHNSNL